MSHPYFIFIQNSHSGFFTCGIDATDNITLTLNGLALTSEFESNPEVSITLQLENGTIQNQS